MADRSGFDRLPTPGCDERVVHARVQVLLFFRVDVETTGRTGWRLVNSTTTTASATPVLPPRRIASNLVNFRGSTSCPTGYQDIQNWSVASVNRNGTGNGGTATLPWACYPDFRWFSCRFPFASLPSSTVWPAAMTRTIRRRHDIACQSSSSAAWGFTWLHASGLLGVLHNMS